MHRFKYITFLKTNLMYYSLKFTVSYNISLFSNRLQDVAKLRSRLFLLDYRTYEN